MEKNSMPPKTKPPPSESSEEESRSSEEGPEDEEQAEGGSDSGSGSDTGTETTINKPISIPPTKQQSALKGAAAATGSNAKRTREANGRRDNEDEPPTKKNKPGMATPAPKAAPKLTVQQSEKKSTTKAEKGKRASSGKEKPSKDLIAEKDNKISARKKPQSPPAAKPATANKSEQEIPQKPKVSSQPWSPDEELALSRELQKDRVNNVYGSVLPSSRSDRYWEKLMGRFSFMDKYEKQQRIERLCEKVRRMRLRYESLNSRLKAGETSVWKNRHEEVLLGIWDTIWGPKKATPSMLNGDDDEEYEDEEEDGSDDQGSDEHDDEEIVRTPGKGRSSTVGRVTAQKKAISNKVVECSSDDDESNEEDTPVKATPPVALAAPGVPKLAATAAATVAGKQASTSNGVPVKDPAPTAMDVNLNTTEKNKSQRAAVHYGTKSSHAVIPPVVEKSVTDDSLPRDVARAENLALLRDMRGTCVKMVEEAKTQSLLLSAKMLEETHAETIQIVQEARVKSAQIMEELRLVVARVGTIAGLNGGMNVSHMGCCNNLSDNLFQGTGLLGNGALPLRDLNHLDDKWREQSEAEHGLLLQRLQLVQEQARIQQEGIRLKLNLRKQQT